MNLENVTAHYCQIVLRATICWFLSSSSSSSGRDIYYEFDDNLIQSIINQHDLTLTILNYDGNADLTMKVRWINCGLLNEYVQ